MRHIDLFTGIGGFAYAAQQVWQNEYEPVLFCEIDKWCQEWALKVHWPDVPIHNDIRSLDAKKYRGTVDLLTGGVPCQPASVAGKRLGERDDRWLWPETLKVMAECQPTWAIFENPRGILTLDGGVVFENLLLEMESYGYEVQPYIVPACAVNAPHRRDRIWIIANSKQSNNGSQKFSQKIKQPETERSASRISRSTESAFADTEGMGWRDGASANERQTEREKYTLGNKTKLSDSDTIRERCSKEQEKVKQMLYDEKRNGSVEKQSRNFKQCRISKSDSNASHNHKFNGNNAGHGAGKIRGEFRQQAGIQEGDVADSTSERLQKSRFAGERECKTENGKRLDNGFEFGNWQEHWYEATTRILLMDDGLPRRLARPKGWRTNALKAIGNAIVPQVAMIFLQAIKEIEHDKRHQRKSA